MPLPDEPNLAIVGATGAVGRELLELLVERCFPHGRLRLLASPRSAGRWLPYGGTSIGVEELAEDSFADIDLAFFSAGGSISRQFAPRAVEAGAIVIDNSSAFRMDDEVPLIVPEINGDGLARISGPGMIANPNCSTIIVLMAVTPLHRAATVRRMVVSTYQAASGAGASWMAELQQQARDFAADRPLTTEATGRRLLFNVFSHDSPIGPEGYNEEEMKLLRETRRIWSDDAVRVTATCVRVPVLRAHSAAINLTFAEPLDQDEARHLLAEAPGVRVVDHRAANRFPEPIDADGLDDVLVGRIRSDLSQAPGTGLDLFVAGDQLRKGAALNAIQIAERLVGAPAAATEG
ncbi:MAG: aspartate-semialdehyde dehydrogenase [Planctomycetota bacterium]|nr:aspartate-semialdehyde dehydrogenase [Planctomycetota bacterium]